MKKIWYLILGLGILGAGGWALKSRLAKPAQAAAVPVKAEEAAIEQTVDATGSIVPHHRVEIKASIAGRIEKLLVSEGDKVRQGQIIAWMSSTDRAAILDAARAQSPEELKKWEDAYKATPIIAPLPGTIILTGTPPGVGYARQPPVWLQPGDEVVVEIDGIGRLVSPVVAAD